MSIKNTMTKQVAAQIARQWPYSRLNVTRTSSGEYVAVGPNSVQLAEDYWYVPREGPPSRRLGYDGVDPVVISDTLMEAVAHNGRASVKDRVTAFDSRCSVRSIGDVSVIELPGGEGAVITPAAGSVALTYGEETHQMPTIGHAIMAVGAILSQE
jgi:hypothetical protein